MLDLVAALPAMRQAAAMEPPAAPVPDAITRDDLQKALAENAQKNESQLQQLAQEHRAQVSELRRAYESRLDEICAAYNERLAEKDQTISELLRELRKAQSAAPTVVHRDAVVPVDERTPESQPAANAIEDVAAPSEPDKVIKAQAIRDQLTADENQQLQQLLATASPEMVAFAEAQIANMSADEAVAYLREHLLAQRQAA